MSDQGQNETEGKPAQASHWETLASNLGADTSKAVDLERPQIEETVRSAKKESTAKARTKKPEVQPKTNWQQLAGWLGISTPLPVEEEIPKPSAAEQPADLSVVASEATEPSEPTKPTEASEAPPAPFATPEEPVSPSSFGADIFDSTQPACVDDAQNRDEVDRTATRPDEVLPGFEVRDANEAEAPAAKDAWERLGFEFKSKPEERPRRDEGVDDLTLGGASEDAFSDTYWDADSSADVVTDDDETEVRFTAGGRRAASQEPEYEEPEDEEPEDEEEEERPQRSRRPRRRRRGGRRSESETESETDDSENELMDEAERRLEESANLFDEAPEIDAVAESSPPPVSQTDEADERTAGRPPHRRIPSWEDAVGVIVDANMANRSRRNSSSSNKDRGGRRGRRRSSR